MRDDFYTRLWRFSRVLKMASSSIHWVTATPAEQAQRYKNDAAFFQKLRASVKLRYAEIDYRDYEKQIQKMLNTYVQADEVIQVVEPVNIFEREAFEAEVEKQISRAKADTIANRTKKTITEKMEEDPFFYRKLSALLQQAIDDYKAERISEAEFLAKVTDIMEQTRGGHAEEVPEVLKENDLSRAFFGALKEQMAPKTPRPSDDIPSDVAREDSPMEGGNTPPRTPPTDEILAEAAVSMDK